VKTRVGSQRPETCSHAARSTSSPSSGLGSSPTASTFPAASAARQVHRDRASGRLPHGRSGSRGFSRLFRRRDQSLRPHRSPDGSAWRERRHRGCSGLRQLTPNVFLSGLEELAHQRAESSGTVDLRRVPGAGDFVRAAVRNARHEFRNMLRRACGIKFAADHQRRSFDARRSAGRRSKSNAAVKTPPMNALFADMTASTNVAYSS